MADQNRPPVQPIARRHAGLPGISLQGLRRGGLGQMACQVVTVDPGALVRVALSDVASGIVRVAITHDDRACALLVGAAADRLTGDPCRSLQASIAEVRVVPRRVLLVSISYVQR